MQYTHEKVDSVDYWLVVAAAGDTIFVSTDSCENCAYTHLYIDLYGEDGVTKLPVMRSMSGNDPQFMYPVPSAGRYFVRVTRYSFEHTAGPYTLHFFERKCPEDRNEPNNSRTEATPITLGVLIEASWCPGGDVDVFAVSLTAGTTLEFTMDGYRTDSYGNNGPSVHLLGPSGERLDSSLSTDIGSARRFTVPTSGTYYIQPSGRGGLRYPYRLSVREAGQVPPGPGDPPTVRVERAIGIAIDPRGDFWGSAGNDVLGRMSLDGRIDRFNPPDIPSVADLAWDHWGNMLVLNYRSLVKFAPPGRTERLITFDQIGAHGLAVSADAIWISNGWTGTNWLYKYNLDGKLLETHNLGAVGAYKLVIGPSGDPYFASGNAIYRFVAGRVEQVLQHDKQFEITGFTFDASGNIYVTDDATGISRVALYDGNGTVLADTFAWYPHEPVQPRFGRNADGSMNARLFVFDRGRLLELNPAGVRGPGLAVQPNGTCPIHAGEAEPNDSPSLARSINKDGPGDLAQVAIDSIVTGVSCMAGDQDFFRLNVPRDVRLQFELEGADQPTLELLATDGSTRLAFSDGALTPKPHFTHTIRAGTDYFIRVGSWFGGPAPYSLRITSSLVAPTELTLQRGARELLLPGTVLTADERVYLDQLGNSDGQYDLADFRAYVRRMRASGTAR